MSSLPQNEAVAESGATSSHPVKERYRGMRCNVITFRERRRDMRCHIIIDTQQDLLNKVLTESTSTSALFLMAKARESGRGDTCPALIMPTAMRPLKGCMRRRVIIASTSSPSHVSFGHNSRWICRFYISFYILFLLLFAAPTFWKECLHL